MSIAWYWMFKGVTSKGIDREVASILECSELNRHHKLQSLAIPETALLFLAKENIAKNKVESRTNTGDVDCISSPFAIDDKFVPDSTTVLRGILPPLERAVTRHNTSLEESINSNSSRRVSIETDTSQDPMESPIDP